MKTKLPFENSVNECHYISDTQFAVFNKAYRYNEYYISNSSKQSSSKSICNAILFREWKYVDKKNDSIVVCNDNGEFLINKKGQISGPYAFIGEPWLDGTRPVKKIEEGVTSWGYVDLNSMEPSLFKVYDVTFFVAPKVGGYYVNGRDYGDYKYQWLKCPNNGIIGGVVHAEFKSITSKFFIGISKNARGNDLITIYRKNSKNRSELKRPYISPDSYISYSYKGASLFEVTQINGLISILYFDKNTKEFVYWPETDKRKYISFHFSDNKKFLIAKKEDGYYSIIHKEQGDLTIFWDNVSVNDRNEISYRFNNADYSLVGFGEIEKAFNQTLDNIKVKFNLQQAVSKNEITNVVDEKIISIQETRPKLDWILFLSGNKINQIKSGYEIHLQRRYNAPKHQKIKKGDTEIIIDYKNKRLYYGTIGFIRQKYYVMSDVEVFPIAKDFAIFNINSEHHHIGKPIDDNIEEFVYNTLIEKLPTTKINQTTKISERINTDTMATEDKADSILNNILSTYRHLKTIKINEDKIFSALEILFKDLLIAKSSNGSSLLDEYVKTKIIQPNFDEIVQKIMETLTDEERDDFEHFYEIKGIKHRHLSQKEAIIYACSLINKNNSLGWVSKKLEPQVPEVTVEEFLKYFCLSSGKEDLFKEQIGETGSILKSGLSFKFDNRMYEIGSIIPDELLDDRKRIYYKRTPGILFIKIDNKMIVTGTIPKRYRIPGVGQERQEFMPNNENTRIKDSGDAIVLIKKDENGRFIYYDIAQYESYEKNDSHIIFTLKSIS